MTDMVERVARAIHLTADKPPSRLMGRDLGDWGSLSPSEREQFRRCAREAIRTMQEPILAVLGRGCADDGRPPADAPSARDLLAIEVIERRLANNPSAYVPSLVREAYQIADAMMGARKQ